MAPDPLLLALQRNFGLLALQNRPFGGKAVFRNSHYEFGAPKKRGFDIGGSCFASDCGELFAAAFLWEAALNCVYEIRVLQRDLGFFESEKAVLPGDVACRITAEADSFLNTIVLSTLQLSAMATQMLIISPVLSNPSLVIPSMALIIGCLGEKLRTMSNKAHLSTDALSAYLNEVFPSILFVKANNAESSERIRFQSLASANLFACLKKKQMKVLIPQLLQIMFFGGSILVRWRCQLTGSLKRLVQLFHHGFFHDITDSVN